MKVFTTQGLVDFALLEVRDTTSLDENARVTATEWYLNGELVRRDALINTLRPVGMESSNG